MNLDALEKRNAAAHKTSDGSLENTQPDRLKHHIPLPGGGHFNTKSLSPTLGRKMGERGAQESERARNTNTINRIYGRSKRNTERIDRQTRELKEGQRYRNYPQAQTRKQKSKKTAVSSGGKFIYRRAVQVCMWWVCTFIWFWQIAMFALFLLLFLAYTYVSEAGFLTRSALWVADLFGNDKAEAARELSITIVLLPWFLSALVCLAVVAFMAMALAMAGRSFGYSPFKGDANQGYMLLTIIGYAIFMFLPLPWAMPWLWHTYLHPKG